MAFLDCGSVANMRESDCKTIENHIPSLTLMYRAAMGMYQQVVYAHSHGESCFYDSVLGGKNGVEYKLVSGDSLQWKPVKLLD